MSYSQLSQFCHKIGSSQHTECFSDRDDKPDPCREKTGEIDRMLRLIAEYYREDEKLTMEMLSSLIR